MDLKQLLQEALNEGNEYIRNEKIADFKKTVRSRIAQISANNEKIEALQADNEALRKSISQLDIKEFKDVTV